MVDATDRSRVLLIVEDDPDVLSSLAQFLQRRLSHVVVLGERTARGGLDRLQRAPPDLIVADFRLPDGTGLDVLRHAMKIAPRAWRVLVTAYPSLTVPDLEGIPNRVFLKPLETEPFAKGLDALLDRHR